MILTHQDIRHYGLRIDEGVTDEQLDNAISEAEEYILRQMIGSAAYIALYTDTDKEKYAGGVKTKADGSQVIIAGLSKAVAHLAFSCLLRSNVNATAFGTTQKQDEYTAHADPFDEAKRHFDIGRAFVREWCEYKGITLNSYAF